MADNSSPAVLQSEEASTECERTPPDGHSAPPLRPPPHQPKKWVHFDEANPDTDGESHEQSSSDQDNNATMVQLPKPPVAPRRSHQLQHSAENGPTVDDAATVSAMTNGEIRNGNDIAQINVTVEEAKKPAKATPLRQESQNNQPATRQPVTRMESRQFENGKIITEKKPENKHCAWVTIAHFDPYKMPKSLISDQITMPVEDYVTAMEMLTNDFRFRCYTVLYRRLIAAWLVASLFILMILLLSGLRGLTLFILTIFWLLATCGGVMVCLCIKKRPRIQQLIQQHKQSTTNGGANSVPSVAIDVDPPTSYAHGRPLTDQEKAEELILKYSQSYVKALVRRTIRFPSRPSEGVRDDVPLHCAHSYCLCQYLRKYHFERPPRKWYHQFCINADLPGQENAGFASTVVAYGYPPVIVG